MNFNILNWLGGPKDTPGRTFLEKMLRVENTTFDSSAVKKPANWKSNSVVHASAIPNVVTMSDTSSNRLGLRPTTKKEITTANIGSEACIYRKKDPHVRNREITRNLCVP